MLLYASATLYKFKFLALKKLFNSGFLFLLQRISVSVRQTYVAARVNFFIPLPKYLFEREIRFLIFFLSAEKKYCIMFTIFFNICSKTCHFYSCCHNDNKNNHIHSFRYTHTMYFIWTSDMQDCGNICFLLTILLSFLSPKNNHKKSGGKYQSTHKYKKHGGSVNIIFFKKEKRGSNIIFFCFCTHSFFFFLEDGWMDAIIIFYHDGAFLSIFCSSFSFAGKSMWTRRVIKKSFLASFSILSTLHFSMLNAPILYSHNQ